MPSRLLTKGDETVIVVGVASWSGSSDIVLGFAQDFVEEHDNCRVEFFDVDQESDLSTLLDISSVPAVLIIKDKTVVDMFTGLMSKKRFTKTLEQYLS